MKKYYSAAALAAGNTIRQLVLILAAMGILQFADVFITMRYFESWPVNAAGGFVAHIPDIICGLGFAAFYAVLCLNGTDRGGSRCRYTIQRLSISEKAVTLIWAGYYFMALLLFWAAEAIICIALSKYYTVAANPELVTEQTMFLAMYKNNFLHSLVPLADTSRYVRNVLMALGLGFAAAGFSYTRRRKNKACVAALATVLALWFPAEMNSVGTDIMYSALSLGAAVVVAVNVIGGWGNEEEAQ